MEGKTIVTKWYRLTVIKCKNAREELAGWRSILDKPGAVIQLPDPSTILVYEAKPCH